MGHTLLGAVGTSLVGVSSAARGATAKVNYSDIFFQVFFAFIFAKPFYNEVYLFLYCSRTIISWECYFCLVVAPELFSSVASCWKLTYQTDF